MVLDRVLDQFRIGLCAENFHNPVFMKRDGTWFEVQQARDLLQRLAFGEELQHLGLPTCNSLFFVASDRKQEINDNLALLLCW